MYQIRWRTVEINILRKEKNLFLSVTLSVSPPKMWIFPSSTLGSLRFWVLLVRFCQWISSVSFIFPLLCFYLFILCSCDTRVGQDGRERPSPRLCPQKNCTIDHWWWYADQLSWSDRIFTRIPSRHHWCSTSLRRKMHQHYFARPRGRRKTMPQVALILETFANPYASSAKNLYMFRVLYLWNSQTTLCWNF